MSPPLGAVAAKEKSAKELLQSTGDHGTGAAVAAVAKEARAASPGPGLQLRDAGYKVAPSTSTRGDGCGLASSRAWPCKSAVVNSSRVMISRSPKRLALASMENARCPNAAGSNPPSEVCICDELSTGGTPPGEVCMCDELSSVTACCLDAAGSTPPSETSADDGLSTETARCSNAAGGTTPNEACARDGFSIDAARCPNAVGSNACICDEASSENVRCPNAVGGSELLCDKVRAVGRGEVDDKALHCSRLSQLGFRWDCNGLEGLEGQELQAAKAKGGNSDT